MLGNPSILSTGAAAYAEAGRFDDAIATAKRVLEMVSPEKDGALVAELRKRMETYERRSPFRDARVVNGVSQKAD
jgi:hypothetical protein